MGSKKKKLKNMKRHCLWVILLKKSKLFETRKTSNTCQKFTYLMSRKNIPLSFKNIPHVQMEETTFKIFLWDKGSSFFGTQKHKPHLQWVLPISTYQYKVRHFDSSEFTSNFCWWMKTRSKAIRLSLPRSVQSDLIS